MMEEVEESKLSPQERIPHLKQGRCLGHVIVHRERRTQQNWNADLQRGAIQFLQACQKCMVGEDNASEGGACSAGAACQRGTNMATCVRELKEAGE